jgi:iron complex transport system ATP-binding protein
LGMNALLAHLGGIDQDLPARPDPGTVALSAHGLGLRVDNDRWLLRDVDLELRAGSVLAVIGPNGAGKSTLLSLLAGDLAATTGSVRVLDMAVDGSNLVALARRRAVLPQHSELSFPFLVGDVVEMGRAPWVGTDQEDSDERAIAHAVEATELDTLLHRRFPTLSGGEQARAAFARTLAQTSWVLLLDEPTAALDLHRQEQLMRLAVSAAEQGCAVLIVLHDIGLAAGYADEIAVLDDGRLVARGAPSEVLTEELLARVYQLPVDVFPHPHHGGLVVTPRRAPRNTSQRKPI